MEKKAVFLGSAPPHEAVSKYFATKKFLESTKIYPEWDLSSVTPSFVLMVVKKEYQRAEKALEEKRKEQSQYREFLDSEWNDLGMKQKQVTGSFASYQTFIQENEKKRDRAKEVIKREKEKKEIFEENIKELEEKIEESLKIQDVMKSYVDQYSNYEAFLKQVVAASDEFRSVKDVINRYRTLISVQRELEERKLNDMATMEHYRKSVVEMTVNKSQEMMVLNNQLIELQSSHERASNELYWWQEMLSIINDNASRLHVEHALVKAAILNIFKQLCKVKTIQQSLISEVDCEAQLKFIKTTYQDLLRIASIAKSRETTEEESIKANVSVASI